MARHHPLIRVTHWVNVLALAIMVGSGLRIFNAHPGFARMGEHFCCYPFEGRAIPSWLTFGGWLAGARHWHFAAMWLLVLNGLVYLAFVWLHGEWRDLVPRRRDPRDAWEMAKFYLFLRRDHPHQGKHNALQKLVYFSLPLFGVLAVLTGLAIWKPVQLAPLTGFFGGYVWARYWHFVVMLVLVGLTAGHVFMVVAVDPYALRSMVTGGFDPTLSPEARNARPFVHLRRRRGGWAGAAGTDGTGPGPEAGDTPRALPHGRSTAPTGRPDATRTAGTDGAGPETGDAGHARRATPAERSAAPAGRPDAASAGTDGPGPETGDAGHARVAPPPGRSTAPAGRPDVAPAGGPDAVPPDVASKSGREES